MSKGRELSMDIYHDIALTMLNEKCDLQDFALDEKAGTLGLVDGLYNSRWQDLDQIDTVRELSITDAMRNAASRAEALFVLGRYRQATESS